MRALANVNANILVQRYVRALDIDIANCANMTLFDRIYAAKDYAAGVERWTGWVSAAR